MRKTPSLPTLDLDIDRIETLSREFEASLRPMDPNTALRPKPVAKGAVTPLTKAKATLASAKANLVTSMSATTFKNSARTTPPDSPDSASEAPVALRTLVVQAEKDRQAARRALEQNENTLTETMFARDQLKQHNAALELQAKTLKRGTRSQRGAGAIVDGVTGLV